MVPSLCLSGFVFGFFFSDEVSLHVIKLSKQTKLALNSQRSAHGQDVLDGIRKPAEPAKGSKSGSSIPPWLLLQFLP